MTDDKINKSITMPLSTKKEIDWLIDSKNPNRKFTNFSDAITRLACIGLLIVKQEGRIESGEFKEELDGIIKNETVWDWIHGLSDSQRRAIKMAVEFAEEGKQSRFEVL